MNSSASSFTPPSASDHPPAFAVPISAQHRVRPKGRYFSVELATPEGPITLDTLPQTLSTHRRFAAFVLSRAGWALAPVRPREWANTLARILDRGRAVTSA